MTTPNLIPALPVVLAVAALAACSSTDNPSPENETTGIHVTDPATHFGLDYSFDPESGQMTHRDARRFQLSEFNPGASTYRTRDFRQGENQYQTPTAPGTGERYETSAARGQDRFETNTSRFQGRSPREAGRASRFAGRDAYDTPTYTTSPYRRSADKLKSGRYLAAERAQSNDNLNRPAESLVRTDRSGDPGVLINKPDDSALTVGDVQDLLNR